MAQENAERKKTIEQIIHEAKCSFFHLDPRITRDFMIPMYVNATTGQWFGEKNNKIPTPPSYVSIKIGLIQAMQRANRFFFFWFRLHMFSETYKTTATISTH